MYALQRQIHHLWWSTVETDTSLHHTGSEGALDVDCETVAIDLAPVLVTIRALDKAIFEEEHKSSYGQHRASCNEGMTVRGLLLIRDAEVHLPVVLDPNVSRLINGFDSDGNHFWRVFPTWKPYADLPSSIQNNTRTKANVHKAYRDFVGGRSVVETVLDAFAFLHRCDPSLARRDDSGELRYFPLTEFIHHDYERRHPDWPSRVEVEREVRARVEQRLPAGQGREIQRRLAVGGATIYAGYTEIKPGRYWSTFVESAEQVAVDIRNGYPYTARTVDSGPLPVVVHSDECLQAGGVDLSTVEFAASPDLLDDDGLRGLWDLASKDAFQYQRQRRGV